MIFDLWFRPLLHLGWVGAGWKKGKLGLVTRSALGPTGNTSRDLLVRQGGIRGDPVVTARNTWGTPGEGQEYQRNTRAKKLVKTKNTDYFALDWTWHTYKKIHTYIYVWFYTHIFLCITGSLRKILVKWYQRSRQLSARRDGREIRTPGSDWIMEKLCFPSFTIKAILGHHLDLQGRCFEEKRSSAGG